MSGFNIGVIGAGLMGHGIAYLLAAAGHEVRIYDPSTQWRDSLAERLESARALLGGDPALLQRISAYEHWRRRCATSRSSSKPRRRSCRSSSSFLPSLKV
jgi:3-hydroxyacyl-CoA dehydrogenase